MFGNLLTTSKFLKVMSAVLVACMLISLTACGTTATQQNATQTTTQYETEEHENEQEPQDPPAEDPDGGYWHDEEPSSTEEPVSPTEEPSSTEEPTDNPPTGAYTYNVDGVQITLRTNIDDYIYTNSAGANCVNMLAIAQSLGFDYTGTHPDELELQIGFHRVVSGNDYFVYAFDEVVNQNMGTIEMDAAGNMYHVSFARNDINDSSIKPYWIANGGNTVRYAINYEQIVIFTFLLENCYYAPSEDWLANSGLPVSTSDNSYLVYK